VINEIVENIYIVLLSTLVLQTYNDISVVAETDTRPQHLISSMIKRESGVLVVRDLMCVGSSECFVQAVKGLVVQASTAATGPESQPRQNFGDS
jgi:hypothetical protein